MGRSKDHKGIHLWVGLPDGLKCQSRQIAAEHPAGVGHDGGGDGGRQLCRHGLGRQAVLYFLKALGRGRTIKLTGHNGFTNHHFELPFLLTVLHLLLPLCILPKQNTVFVKLYPLERKKQCRPAQKALPSRF
jgi:hypothetical protein